MNSFPKSEHLCSRKLIDRLYAEGQRIRLFPYSVQWLEVAEAEVPCQVMIVASKRKFHHAVDRNRIKRLTRECYRTRKHPLTHLLAEQHRSILLSLYYIGPTLPEFAALGERMDKLINTMVDTLAAQ